MNFAFERCIDPLGRIVIPMDLSRMLNISPKDTMPIVVENGKLILEKKTTV